VKGGKMEEDKSLRDEIRELKEVMEETKEIKSKKFKLPFRARVGKIRLKQGYVTVAIIQDNKEIAFKKEPIIDGVIKLHDKKYGDTFHAIGEQDIFTYKGKPFVWQAVNKLNPFNPLTGMNETYGQKYVMARMESDKITQKKNWSWGLIIIGIIAVGGLAWYIFKK
jgi:hypothetical protein